MPVASTAQALARLQPLLAGLLFVSEADYPLVLTRLARSEALEVRSLLLAAGRPADSPVEERSLAACFARAVAVEPYYSASERSIAARYRDLVRFLSEELEGTRVFRLGAIDVDVYVLGKTSDGEWLGVATKVIET